MAYGIQLSLIVRPANSPAKIVTREITVTSSSARHDFYEALQNDDLQLLETSEGGIQVDHKIFANNFEMTITFAKNSEMTTRFSSTKVR